MEEFTLREKEREREREMEEEGLVFMMADKCVYEGRKKGPGELVLMSIYRTNCIEAAPVCLHDGTFIKVR